MNRIGGIRVAADPPDAVIVNECESKEVVRVYVQQPDSGSRFPARLTERKEPGPLIKSIPRRPTLESKLIQVGDEAWRQNETAGPFAVELQNASCCRGGLRRGTRGRVPRHDSNVAGELPIVMSG